MKSISLVLLFVAAAVTLPLEDDQFFYGIEARIAGGQVAQPNQFPYQVGLRLNLIDPEYGAWCGGSLISDQVVLTAAHCLQNSTGGIVYLGAHDRKAVKEDGRKLVNVKKSNYIVHEKYDNVLQTDDIALIVLPEKVKLTNKISLINLPRASIFDVYGRVAIVSGWGRTGDAEYSSTRVLHFPDQRIMSNDYCHNPYNVILMPSQICASTANGKSACQGDSSGPLAIEETDLSKTVVGVGSYGKVYGCEKGYPIVFTRVSYYLSWIHEKTGIPVGN